MMSPFRTSPPSGDGRQLILRPRLLAELAHRFDTRLTTIVGAAGFGKTVLLAQAFEQNQLVTVGKDIWVACEPDDADAPVLSSAILAALGADPGRRGQDPVESVVEAVWNHAPFDVAIILDDFHVMPVGSAGEKLVADLVHRLPANGHMVIASRRPVPFAISKLRSVGQLIEINQDALGFDDPEFAEFLGGDLAESGPKDEGPRWPALAALVAQAGHEAAFDYLWDEILADRPDQDRHALALIAPFQFIDEELLHVVTESTISADELLGGLPLVVSGPSRLGSDEVTWQLHSLWLPALRGRVSADERTEALRRGGQHLLDRDEFLASAEAFALADDVSGLMAAATAMCFRPLTRTWVDESRKLLRLLPPSLAGTGVAQLLEAFAELEMRHQWNALGSFERAATDLRAEGLPELESQALCLASQISGLRDGLPPAPHLYPRMVELAQAGTPLAVSLVARFDACTALMNGDPLGATRFIDQFSGFGPIRAEMLIDQLWVDAGYPEHVGGVATHIADLNTQGQIDVQLSYALWVRGEVPAEVALPIVLDLIAMAAGQRISHQSIQVLGLATSVALATGDLQQGQKLAAQNRTQLDPDLGPLVGAYVDIGDAAVCLAAGDEDGATQILRELLERVPLGCWPPRPYLHFLSPLYVLVPETRELLDSLQVGPAISEVIAASRALVGYRETGERANLETIDWRRFGSLRANMAFPHLVEIALGSKIRLDSEHVDEPQRVTIPHRVLTLLARSDRPVAPMAKTALGDRIGSPGYKLELSVFGSMELYRDGELVEDENWQRRERVRMLCGYMVHHPKVSRREVCAALWPDLDETKALSNLRVNLRLLLQVFEPDRPSGAPSWFVESDGPILELSHQNLKIDVVEFDAMVAEARVADDRGIPGQALDLYRRAADLFRGDYLDGRIFDAWAEFERIRLRSAAALACARVAELLLAKGEPEVSMRYASRSLQSEPLLERAHRCRVRAFLGLEDRGAARDAAKLLISTMDDAGLVLEPDSLALLASLGLTVAVSAGAEQTDRSRP